MTITITAHKLQKDLKTDCVQPAAHAIVPTPIFQIPNSSKNVSLDSKLICHLQNNTHCSKGPLLQICTLFLLEADLCLMWIEKKSTEQMTFTLRLMDLWPNRIFFRLVGFGLMIIVSMNSPLGNMADRQKRHLW